MVQNVTLKGFDPIGKTTENQNNTLGEASEARTARTARVASADSKNVLETKDTFGEAATLELSKDNGKQDSLYSNMIYTSILTSASRANKVKGTYTAISDGEKMTLPKPGAEITVSLGTDKKSIKATVSKTNAWSIEYSIAGCRKSYPDGKCTKRLNSALDKFSYNSGKDDLLKFDVPGLGKSYAGAMVDGFGSIGDVAEVTLDDGTKFNFMILDTKSTKHNSSELSPNNQCQNEYGHGYMLDNKTVQLSVCEFITSQSVSGKSSAKNYPSGDFLSGRYVKSAKIIGHTNIE